MILDIHCHYTLTRQPHIAAERFSFEPAVVSDDPTGWDSCLSPRTLGRWTTWLLRAALRLPEPGPPLDALLSAFTDRQLRGPGPVERWVLLAFDAYHDDDGRRPPLPQTGAALGSDIYSSNSFVRDACRQHPDRYLFGASVHPYRPDALAALDEVWAAGACLLKLMPLHQNVNPSDPRTLAFFSRCAELGLPLLLHFGPEFALKTYRREFAELETLLVALRKLRTAGRMPITIIAHAATPVLLHGPWRPMRQLVAALRGEFADAPLYADLAALLAPGKLVMLGWLARQQDLHHKLLFATDFPVTPALPWWWWRLGEHWPRGVASWSQQAVAILRWAGFNEIIFHRAATLLPHVR